MVSELKNYQSQVQAYKFEIDRINGQVTECKQAYFQQRRQELMGIVPELDEDAYRDEDGNTNQYDEQMAYNEQQQQYMAMQQQQQQD